MLIEAQIFYRIYTRCVGCEQGIDNGLAFDLCPKCTHSKNTFHPPTHRLVQCGQIKSPQHGLKAATSEGRKSVSENLVLETPVYEVDDNTADVDPKDTSDVPNYEEEEED